MRGVNHIVADTQAVGGNFAGITETEISVPRLSVCALAASSHISHKIIRPKDFIGRQDVHLLGRSGGSGLREESQVLGKDIVDGIHTNSRPEGPKEDVVVNTAEIKQECQDKSKEGAQKIYTSVHTYV